MSRSAASRGMSEGVLAASFEFGIKLGSAERLAYACVVAGGANAVTCTMTPLYGLSRCC